jgi:lysophospholipase L1-like esterase
MRRRLLIVPPLTLVAVLAAVELTARFMDTDMLQHEAIAVAAGRGLGETWHEEGTAAWLETAEALGVDYLPDEFELEEGGFHSRWGFCAFGFEGPTVLAMGDSTTRQSMVERDGQRFGDVPQNTWPMLLKSHLGPGVQVCVLAENGYHPGDLSRLLEGIQPRLEPDLVLVLLCENDLAEAPPRVRVDRGDAFVYYRAVAERPVVPALYWYPLYLRSEAFRFLHWRLALAWPSRAGEIELTLRDTIGVDGALRSMEDQPGALGVYYLPLLDDAEPAQPPRLAELNRLAGIEVHPVVLPAPRAAYRRTDDDPVHMNLAGHQRVVEAVLPAVRATLGDDPARAGSQP